MKRICIQMIAVVVSLQALGQQVVIITNNVNDLNPQRDAFTVDQSRQVRLTAILNDGVDAYNMTAAAFPVFLTITHRIDGHTNLVTRSIAGTASNNYVRWSFSFPDIGEYEIYSEARYQTGDDPIVHNYVTATAAPPYIVLNPINEITMGSTVITNIYESGSFPTYVSNYVDLAEYHITNIYFPTSGVVSLNGFTGAVSLVTQATTNSAGVSAWDGLTLNVGTGFPSYLVRQSELSVYATGTPLYTFTETDPIWTAEKSGYATGTPLYIETDPIWSGASNLYYLSAQADALFATGTPLYELSSDVVLKSAIGDIAGDNLYGTGGKLNVRGKALSYGPMELNQFSGTLFQNSGYSTGISSNSTPSSFGFYQVQSGSAIVSPQRIFGSSKSYRVYVSYRCDGGFNDGLHGLVRISDNNGQSYNLSGLTDVWIGTAQYSTFVSSVLDSGTTSSYSYRLETYFAAYNGGNGATIQDTTIFLIGEL